MVTRLSHLRRLLLLVGTLLAVSLFTVAEDQEAGKGVTFSHVYKIGTDCKVGSQALLTQDQTTDSQGALQEMTVNGENDVVFRHNIRLQTPSCSCSDNEEFQSLLYRVNGLEEEVTYLKAQCAQGCCKSAGMDTSCSGHGTFQQDTCKCLCDPGWEGPDCSLSTCPDDCNDNGRCVDGRCVCHVGYTGDDCSQLLCPDNCNDKGHCVDGKCVCFPHFTGEDCSVQRCPNDCIGNGRCVDGRCICDEGFFGEDCSLVMGPKYLRLLEATEMSLLVEWDFVQGAEYYVLTYHPEGDEGAMVTVNVPNTENSYLITGLVSGVNYIVQVYAVIKETNSETVSLEATTVVSGIGDIRVLGQTEDSIQVDWKNPEADLDYFRLTHASPDGREEEQSVSKSEEARTKHTIVGLFPGTEYQITVQAIKGTSEGKSSSVTGTTDIDSPSTLVTTAVTESTASVSWDRVQAEIDGYILQYVSALGSSKEISVGADTTAYTLTGLRPGVVYTIYVWAFKGSRASRKSSTEAETDIDAPTNLLTREVTEESALVSWDKVQAEVDGYMLSYTSPDGTSQEISVGAENTHMLTGLKPGVIYTIYVWAIKGSRSSKKTSTEAETDIDAPTNLLTREVTEESALVSWNKVQAEVDGYMLSYTSPDGTSQEVFVGPDNTYKMANLKPGVVYTIYVWAVKGKRASKKTSSKAETDIDAPTNLLTREVTEESALVSWNKVQAEVDGYMLSYTSPDGTSQEVFVGPDNTYKMANLKPGVIYTIYVWATKGSRSSKKTSTEAETEIDAPKNLRASDVQTESAALSWTAPQADIDGYILTYRPEDGSMQTVERKLKRRENKFSMSGLAMGKRYIVTLIAYRGAKRSRVVETTFSTVGIQYPFPMDCTQLMKNGEMTSGVYTIYINSDRSRPIQVYCDMTTDGGGWLVFQRRNTGKLDFMKRWRQYIAGFGELTDEFWLGLEKIYELTNTPTRYEVRFDLGLGSEKVYAVYDYFKLGSAKQKFTLTVGNYRGNAGDAMTYHQGRNFTTMDNDNDIALSNCAIMHRGAWWYKNCHLANLNGKFGDNRHSMGVNWEPWKGHLMSLDFSEIKIRPASLASRKRRSLMAKERKRLA
ncbi:tenascin-N isoform X1 [Engraulis encrasicolus]|uniref:tenascin-N isoform X1 n=1 Tax=Engraulis encrasicolus TaxID=184585 RepID=UPI002FD368BC